MPGLHPCFASEWKAVSAGRIEDENDFSVDFMPLLRLASKIVSKAACVACVPNTSADKSLEGVGEESS